MSAKILLLGCGNVGGAFVELLERRGGRLTSCWDVDIELAGVVRRSTESVPGLDTSRVFADIETALKVAEPDVVVELIGGVDTPRAMILRALEYGAHVVTANKAVLAAHGAELSRAANDAGKLLLGEASVGGAVPILRTLHTSLASDNIQRIIGVWNGTCNYILTRMEREKADFNDVLADAQRLGYAEADPALDIGGGDTAHKAVVLGQLAFGVFDPVAEGHYRGITQFTPEDIAEVVEWGLRPKLVGLLARQDEGVLRYVGPALLPETHAVASLESVNNGIYVESTDTGAVFLSGPGAGPMPTATAVLGDVIEAVRTHAYDESSPRWGHQADHPCAALPYTQGRFPCYIRVRVKDEAGVLAKLTSTLAEQQISIRSVEQPISHQGRSVALYLTTHPTPLSQIEAAVATWEKMEIIEEPAFWVPILEQS